MAATQEERMTGNVAKLVDRLSKDLSSKDIIFRKPGPVTTTKIATVRYSYEAAHDDELSLKVDDVIDVVEDAESGWMKGKLRGSGRIGLFPTNFVQFSDSQPGPKNGVAKTETKKKAPEGAPEDSPEAVQRSSVTDVVKNRTAASFVPPSAKKPEHEGGEPDSAAAKEMARVLYLYTPNHDDELALKEIGALITVVSKTCADPGWFLGEVDGKKGLIPDNFVEFVKVPAAGSDTRKGSGPLALTLPNVPAKPAKPPGLGASTAVGSGGRRVGTTSTTFAAMHTTLADALNKPPKTFAPKPVQKQEEGSAETRAEEPLAHITTSRPKQPNKRPPSTVFNKRKSGDLLMDVPISEASEPELTPSVPIARTTAPSSVPFPTQPIFSVPTVTPPTSVIKNDKGDIEYVSYAEFQRLADKFQEFRTEMLLRLAQLEAKLAISK